MILEWNPSKRMTGERWCDGPAGRLASKFVVGAVLTLLFGWLGFMAGCGDDGPAEPPAPDGSVGSLRLVIVSPGQDVGLLSGGTVSLVVRLEDEQGEGQAGRTVSFSLDGSPAGSVLEQPDAQTDGDGRASVVLRAGWTPTSFIVRAEAADAAPIRFEVVVSDAGFGALDIGVVADETVSGATPISVVLYFDAPCANMTPNADPAKVRVLLDPGKDASFEFLPLDRFVSVRAETAQDEQGRVQSGCLDVPVGSLRENLTLKGRVVLSIRSPRLASGYFVETRLDFEPSPGGLLDTALSDVRRLGACPNATGTGLVDCLLSALSNPGAPAENLVCNGDAETELARALDRARGVQDGRCRGDLDSQGHQGVEYLLASDVADSALMARLRSLGPMDLESLTIRSLLQLHPTASGGWVGEHRLLSAWITSAGDQFAVSFNELGLSGASVSEFSVTSQGGTQDFVVFGGQQFLFRPALVVKRALIRWLFETDEQKSLATGFARLFGSGSGDLEEACSRVDAALCARVGEDPGCLGESCVVALQAWAATWDRAFLDAMVQRGVDLRFDAGRAVLQDTDGNSVAESMGGAHQPGQWDAVISLPDEELQPTASFSGVMALGEVF